LKKSLILAALEQNRAEFIIFSLNTTCYITSKLQCYPTSAVRAGNAGDAATSPSKFFRENGLDFGKIFSDLGKIEAKFGHMIKVGQN